MTQSILIIDDSPDIHALLEVRLRGEGVELRHALTPAAGLAAAVEHKPDLVLLDIEMPGRSGFDVCRELKANPDTAAIPVIFLTGHIEQKAKVAGLDLGAVDYVTKPFDVAELRARVRSALRIKSLQDQLIALARIDQLTGLWNRAYFDSRLEQEIAEVHRSGRPLGLLIVDVDHFKAVNDTHGHPAGDQVLRSLASRLQGVLRATDVACRYGGEEFALLLPGIAPEESEAVAERVREVVAATWVHAGSISVPVTVSVGIASSVDFGPPLRPDGPQLVARADAALYSAKHAGRNRVCYR